MKPLSKEQFQAMLERYRSGNSSPEEIRFLSAYYRALKKTQIDISGQKQENLSRDIWDSIQQNISERENKTRSIFKTPLLWWSAAVVALLVLLSGGILFLRPPSAEVVAKKTETAPAISTNNVIELPDGSIVILKPGSKIDFPKSFGNAPNREVSLTGEAYFDVRHKKNQPFVVHSGELITTVLGTTFSIKAQPGDKSITVTVNSGKVRVSNRQRDFTVLTTNEQATYYLENKGVSQKEIDADVALAWKFDDLVFDDVTIETAVRILGERFETKIEVKDTELARKRFTTIFSKDEPLESALNSICIFNEAVFRVDSTAQKILIVPF